MTITALPTPPLRSDPSNFAARADSFLAALPVFVAEANDVAVAMNLNATNSTSTTSNTVATGAKTFTVQSGKSYQPGMYVVVADTAAPSTNSMFCQVVSYSGTTLVVTCLSLRGSGTKTAWAISQCAPGGALAGPLETSGITGAAVAGPLVSSGITGAAAAGPIGASGITGAALAGAIGASGITGAALAGDIGDSGITGAARSGNNTDITSITGNAATATTAATANALNAANTYDVTGINVTNLAVGAGVSSSITMADSDEGSRVIHCNSHQIGFLTQAGGWGAWCDDAGNWTAAANVVAYSDERLKRDWRDLPGDFLWKLAGVKTGVYARTDIEATQVGVSAQSLQEVLPESVVTGADGMLAVSYGNAALTACVLLAREVMSLKAEISALKGGQP